VTEVKIQVVSLVLVVCLAPKYVAGILFYHWSVSHVL